MQRFKKHTPAPKPGIKRSASQLSVSGDEADEMNCESIDMGQDDPSKMAKYHPNFQTIYPSVRTVPETTAVAPSTTTTGMPASYAAKPSAVNLAAQRQSLLAGNPSGVAVATLISTANSIGMTLEQLAMSLSTTPNLLRALSTQPAKESKLQLALNLYKNDCRALLQRCMLLAGYEGSEITEGCPTYMDVALKAWESEGKRLEFFLGCHSNAKASAAAKPSDPNNTDNAGLCDCLPGVGNASELQAIAPKACGLIVSEHRVLVCAGGWISFLGAANG